MSLREKYVERFGEEEAEKLFLAALEHGNGINDKNKGSDPFCWAIFITIGWDCVKLYGDYHSINVKWEDFLQFCRDYKDELYNHNGDVDYPSLVCGVYDEVFEK